MWHANYRKRNASPLPNSLVLYFFVLTEIKIFKNDASNPVLVDRS